MHSPSPPALLPRNRGMISPEPVRWREQRREAYEIEKERAQIARAIDQVSSLVRRAEGGEGRARTVAGGSKLSRREGQGEWSPQEREEGRVEDEGSDAVPGDEEGGCRDEVLEHGEDGLAAEEEQEVERGEVRSVADVDCGSEQEEAEAKEGVRERKAKRREGEEGDEGVGEGEAIQDESEGEGGPKLVQDQQHEAGRGVAEKEAECEEAREEEEEEEECEGAVVEGGHVESVQEGMDAAKVEGWRGPLQAGEEEEAMSIAEGERRRGDTAGKGEELAGEGEEEVPVEVQEAERDEGEGGRGAEDEGAMEGGSAATNEELDDQPPGTSEPGSQDIETREDGAPDHVRDTQPEGDTSSREDSAVVQVEDVEEAVQESMESQEKEGKEEEKQDVLGEEEKEEDETRQARGGGNLNLEEPVEDEA